MRVKEKYSSVSEAFLFEFIDSSNWGRTKLYAYWMSVKNLDISELDMDDYHRIGKILDLHKDLLSKKWKRR